MGLVWLSKKNVVVSLFSQMEPVGIGLSAVLLLVSVYSWAVIIERLWFFRSVGRGIREFERVFGASRNLAQAARELKDVRPNPLSRLFERGYSLLKESFDLLRSGSSAEGWLPGSGLGMIEMQIDLLRQSLSVCADEEAALLERRLGVLGTIAAACPFIGLLGTVWGIMVAFYNMGAAGSADFRVVTAGISSALMTTVAGLVAAIPALCCHNLFVHRAQQLTARIDDFSDKFQRLAGRWFVQALKTTGHVKEGAQS